MRNPNKFRFGLIPFTGMIYVAILMLIVLFGAITFRTFYDEMSPLIEAQMNESYREYLKICAIFLSFYLGIWSGFYGNWRKSHLQGLMVLAIGFILTGIALHALPWIQFPNDQYPATMGWILGGFAPSVICWILVTFFTRFFKTKTQTNVVN